MSKQPIILGGGLAGLSACFHGTGVLYEKNVGIGGSASSEENQGFILIMVFVCIPRTVTFWD